MPIEYLEGFSPAVGDWIAVYAWPEAPPGVDPWILEPVIGWAVVDSSEPQVDGYSDTHRAIRPVIGGDVITIDGDGWLGVYRRIYMNQPRIREQLLAACGRTDEPQMLRRGV